MISIDLGHFFIKSSAPLNGSPSPFMSSFILSIQLVITVVKNRHNYILEVRSEFDRSVAYTMTWVYGIKWPILQRISWVYIVVALNKLAITSLSFVRAGWSEHDSLPSLMNRNFDVLIDKSSVRLSFLLLSESEISVLLNYDMCFICQLRCGDETTVIIVWLQINASC